MSLSHWVKNFLIFKVYTEIVYYGGTQFFLSWNIW